MISNKKIYYYVILIFPFLPIIFFLNKTNFSELFLIEFFYIIGFQILVFLVLICLSLFAYRLVSKIISLSLLEFVSVNSIIFYLFFFYKKINLFFTYLFGQINNYLDNIISLFIYIGIFFLLIKLIRTKFFLVSLFFYLLINLVILLINIYQFNTTKINDFKDFQSNNVLKNLNLEKISSSKNNENIFFIILDGMPSIDIAKKLKLIKNEHI